jgi:hypothetical protein
MGKSNHEKETMKVFCIGLSRTGTTSLCDALSVLGLNTLHFSLGVFVNQKVINDELIFIPVRKLNLFRKWRRKKEIEHIKNTFDFDIFDKYHAFGDLPIPLFFKQLDQKYPNSKFIYTYRNEDKWLKSMKWLFCEGAVQWRHGLINDEIKYAAYGCFKYDEKNLIKSYREHHADVIDYFKNKPESLLFLDLDKESLTFKAICDFIGVKLPNVPFPVLNKSQKQPLYKRIDYWMGRNSIPYSLFKIVIKKTYK